jgi:hypothetical protein
MDTKAEKIVMEIFDVAKKIKKEIGQLKNQYTYLCDKIDNRVDYIIHTICKEFNRSLNYYNYANADDDGYNGYFDFEEYKKSVNIVTSISNINRYDGWSELLVILEGEHAGEWNLADGFPTAWLFNDFEKELKNGIKKYKNKEIERKNKAKLSRDQKKEEKKKLLKEIEKKLSKEELEALRSAL